MSQFSQISLSSSQISIDSSASVTDSRRGKSAWNSPNRIAYKELIPTAERLAPPLMSSDQKQEYEKKVAEKKGSQKDAIKKVVQEEGTLLHKTLNI